MDYTKVIKDIKVLLGLEDNVVEEVVETVEIEAKSIKIKDTETLVYYTDETIIVDTIVYTDEEMTKVLETGDYVLEDGVTIKVTEGVVNEVIPVEVVEDVVEDVEVIAVDEVIEDVVEEVVEDEIDYKAKYEELVAKLEALELKFSDATKAIEEKENKINLQSDEIKKLNEEPITEPISKKPADVPVKSNMENRLDTLNALRNLKG